MIPDTKPVDGLEEATPGPWFRGSYTATPYFKSISEHAAVCREDGGLLAVTGKVDDRQSIIDAEFVVLVVNNYSALKQRVKVLEEAARKAFKELNEIRARDGVPYTSDGWKSSVDPKYFSSVVDELSEALAPPVGEKEKNDKD